MDKTRHHRSEQRHSKQNYLRRLWGCLSLSLSSQELVWVFRWQVLWLSGYVWWFGPGNRPSLLAHSKLGVLQENCSSISWRRWRGPLCNVSPTGIPIELRRAADDSGWSHCRVDWVHYSSGCSSGSPFEPAQVGAAVKSFWSRFEHMRHQNHEKKSVVCNSVLSYKLRRKICMDLKGQVTLSFNFRSFSLQVNTEEKCTEMHRMAY